MKNIVKQVFIIFFLFNPRSSAIAGAEKNKIADTFVENARPKTIEIRIKCFMLAVFSDTNLTDR